MGNPRREGAGISYPIPHIRAYGKYIYVIWMDTPNNVEDGDCLTWCLNILDLAVTILFIVKWIAFLLSK